MRMPLPSRSRPSPRTVVPSGLIWVLIFTTAPINSSSVSDRTGLPPTITAAAVIAMRLGHIFKPREPKRLRMTNPDSIDKLPMYNEG